ncbi:hypothetical protein [Streptomyces sp. A1136]|uniref:hypothetical protein n=1 Tax=Streptomyces sp. A1136 TaxID=2563102 RepID=UPI00109E3A83|nr:hypothetical protein [Streptomyces sp. A1136]THA44494.1 hypothetical protein E6R62_36780 [Streptomyces sp. A1136]
MSTPAPRPVASLIDVPDVEVSDEEIEAAIALAGTLSGRDLGEMHDEYRQALEKLIEAKAAGSRPEPVETPAPASVEVVDLMAMLEKSVSEAKASRSGGPDAAVHDLPAAKKTTKKTAAKKTAAKETPAKKTAGRKPRSV